jgi:hypothetical protein
VPDPFEFWIASNPFEEPLIGEINSLQSGLQGLGSQLFILRPYLLESGQAVLLVEVGHVFTTPPIAFSTIRKGRVVEIGMESTPPEQDSFLLPSGIKSERGASCYHVDIISGGGSQGAT